MSFPEVIEKLDKLADALDKTNEKANKVLDKANTILDKTDKVVDNAGDLGSDSKSILKLVKITVILLLIMTIVGFLLYFGLKAWSIHRRSDHRYSSIEME